MKLDQIITLLFFLGLFVLGSFIYKDYGISNDELFGHDLGTLNLAYVLDADKTLLGYVDKDYPPLIEVTLVSIERLLLGPGADSQQAFYLRHYCLFIFFFIGVIAFYHLLSSIFQRRWWALLATLMLVVMPRIFAHSFFNSKDIPFMVMMIISSLTAMRLIHSPSIVLGMIHAMATAITIDTRMAGLMIIPMTVLLLISKKDIFLQIGWFRWVAIVLVYLLLTACLVVLAWPMLWQNTWTHFYSFLQSAGHFRFPYRIFYGAEWLQPVNHQLPWHYLPLWIGTTVPIMILGLFVLGSGFVIFSIFRNSSLFAQGALGVWSLGWFYIPLILVLIANPTLYDGWRHLYFIYPAMILLAIYGLKQAVSIRVFQIILLVLLGLNLTTTAIKSFKLHPYEHLYFNEFYRQDLSKALSFFQMDSWGVEFKEAFDYIDRHERRPLIKVYSNHVFAPNNLWISSKELRQRVVFVANWQQADYLIFDYYFLVYNPDRRLFGKEVYKLTRSGVDLMALYQLH